MVGTQYEFEKRKNLGSLVPPLTDWLTERMGTDVEVGKLETPIGAGASNETVFFTLAARSGTEVSERELVLRLHPREQYQLYLRPRFAMQFQLLQHLHRDGTVKVPNALWYEEDASVLGLPFFVMDRVQGRVLINSPTYNDVGWLADAPARERREIWESAVRSLATVHQVPMGAVEFMADERIGVPDLRHLLDEFAETLSWSAGVIPHPVLTEVLQWLLDNFPADPQVGLAWGDARMGNMIFGESGVTCIVDWEQVSLAGGMNDLGWWLLFDEINGTLAGTRRLEGLGTRSETVDLWRDAGGEPVRDLLWYEVLAGFRLSTFPLRRMLQTGNIPSTAPEENVVLNYVCRLLEIAPPAARAGI